MRTPNNEITDMTSERTVEQSVSIDSALAHISAGRLAEAKDICRALLAADPDQGLAWHLLGGIALQQGDADTAIDYCSRAIRLSPSLSKARSNLGAALLTKGRLSDAIAALQGAIETDPNFAPAYVNLGDALLKADRVEEAVMALEQAVALQPRNALAHSNLGAALTRHKRPDAAITALRQAIALDPKSVSAHNNLGNALRWAGDYDGALAALKRARELNPDMPEVHAHLGMVYRAMGRWDDAVACYDKAIALRPEFVDGKYYRSAALLAQGRFPQGWRDYLERYSMRGVPPSFHRTPLAKSLDGLRLFLVKDQGLGDEIFFLRFVPELKRRGAYIIYRASAKIASLVGRLPFLDAVVTDDILMPSADLVVSVGDLPFLLDMASVDDVPASIRLPALPDRRTSRQAALTALGPPPYIGVTWQAGADVMKMLYKVAPLERIGACLRHIEGTLIALQREPRSGEIDALAKAAGRPVHDLTGLNDNLEDMLALLALLDDYVTVSNTNVHLRAAVNRGSRVLVPSPPEFRWMATGSVSPWFPDCRVYRQGIDGSWDEALAGLTADLASSHGAVRRGTSQ
jgi:tetratricopeptide (TPR) repeat protein